MQQSIIEMIQLDRYRKMNHYFNDHTIINAKNYKMSRLLRNAVWYKITGNV